jgi:hypothetical protein
MDHLKRLNKLIKLYNHLTDNNRIELFAYFSKNWAWRGRRVDELNMEAQLKAFSELEQDPNSYRLLKQHVYDERYAR